MQTGAGWGGWLGELVYGPRPCSAAERCSLDLSRRRLDRAPVGGPVPSREWGNGPDRHQLLCWPRFLCFTHSARSAYGAPILLQAFPTLTLPTPGGPGNPGPAKAGTVLARTESAVWRGKPMPTEHWPQRRVHRKVVERCEGERGEGSPKGTRPG